ncbi:MAG TPA: FAD-dependent oxidoreductase [Candidatus Doudnabacteria bacterium]|nr:FAD-dependent oxidoreductase [Candidatus Doudnabacteria bacterium]
MKQKQIIVIGAGFGGVRVALNLAKNQDFSVTIIDQFPHHSVHGQLYEVATSPTELTMMPELKRSVELPLSQIFHNSPVKIVTAKVADINFNSKTVTANKNYSYDYLVCALGSQPNFFSIPGANEHALHFSSGYDALKIRGEIESTIAVAKSDIRKKDIRIVVAGGGVAGVEVAAELQGMLNYLAWRENYPRHKIITSIIDRSETILSMFPKEVQEIANQRLEELGVVLDTGVSIESISKQELQTNRGVKEFDILIWAAGVRANPLPTTESILVKKGDRVEVDAQFRLVGHKEVFVLGDQCARIEDGGSNPLPGTASQAIRQANYVASAINALAQNQQPQLFACQSLPYLIPLGPKWAIFYSNKKIVKGYFGYLIRQMVWLKYYISILGFAKGLHWLLRTSELFKRND